MCTTYASQCAQLEHQTVPNLKITLSTTHASQCAQLLNQTVHNLYITLSQLHSMLCATFWYTILCTTWRYNLLCTAWGYIRLCITWGYITLLCTTGKRHTVHNFGWHHTVYAQHRGIVHNLSCIILCPICRYITLYTTLRYILLCTTDWLTINNSYTLYNLEDGEHLEHPLDGAHFAQHGR